LLGQLGIDNSGSRSTGEERLSAGLSLNSPLGLGDQFNASTIHSAGSDYVRVAYSVPVAADGLRLGLNGSYLDYRLVAPEFALLKGQGTTESVGLEATYPLLRTRQRNLFLSLAQDQKRLHNEALGGVQSDYEITGWTVGLAGNLFDSLGGGGANSMNLQWSEARLNQGLADAAESPALTGVFDKWHLALSRQQVIAPGVSLLAAVNTQDTHKNLDSSERFTLGGPTGVRAYPVGEGSGSRGTVVNLDLRWRLSSSLVSSAFYDWGEVANINTGPGYCLRGYGLGLLWTVPLGATVQLVWARRDGDNPNPTTTGRDQYGSLQRDRMWLSASLPF
jgi:hemolysin activation/secretion protein